MAYNSNTMCNSILIKHAGRSYCCMQSSLVLLHIQSCREELLLYAIIPCLAAYTVMQGGVTVVCNHPLSCCIYSHAGRSYCCMQSSPVLLHIQSCREELLLYAIIPCLAAYTVLVSLIFGTYIPTPFNFNEMYFYTCLRKYTGCVRKCQGKYTL